MSEDGLTFEKIFELTHVSGPTVGKEPLPPFGRKPRQLLPELSGETFETVLCKKQDVTLPLPKWRKGDRKDVEVDSPFLK